MNIWINLQKEQLKINAGDAHEYPLFSLQMLTCVSREDTTLVFGNVRSFQPSIVFKKYNIKLTRESFIKTAAHVFQKNAGQQLFDIQHSKKKFPHQDEKCLRRNNFSG